MKSEPCTPAEEGVFSLKVLIAFDTVCSGKRAKGLCDRLNRNLGSGYELKPSLWSLAALEHSPLAQAAVAEATAAPLVILAVQADALLSPPIRSCLDRCACRLHANCGALVLQLQGTIRMDAELVPAYRFLKQIVEDTGLAFFLEVIEPADNELDCSIEFIHQRAHLPTPVLDATLQWANSPRWGLKVDRTAQHGHHLQDQPRTTL